MISRRHQHRVRSVDSCDGPHYVRPREHSIHLLNGLAHHQHLGMVRRDENRAVTHSGRWRSLVQQAWSLEYATSDNSRFGKRTGHASQTDQSPGSDMNAPQVDAYLHFSSQVQRKAKEENGPNHNPDGQHASHLTGEHIRAHEVQDARRYDQAERPREQGNQQGAFRPE